MTDSYTQHFDQTHSAEITKTDSTDLTQILSPKKLTDWKGSLTTFNGFTDTRPNQELINGTWDEVAAILRPEKPVVLSDKKRGKYCVPCPLKVAQLVGKTLEAAEKAGGPTIGKMRSKAHVTEAALLIIDVDGLSEADFLAGLKSIEADNITYLAFTTYSHGSIEKSGIRARVAIPLDNPVTVEEYVHAWHGVDNKYWGGQADKADASGDKLYQQQGTWACHPSRADVANSWSNRGGVPRANILIEIGSTPISGTLDISSDKVGAKFANNLSLNTEVETEDRSILSIRQILERGITDKLRCQTPFRDSQSWAAFFSTNPDGIPFIFDSGTNITHWLNEFEVDEAKLIAASSVITQLIPKLKEDSAAALEDKPVEALATIQQNKPAEYQRIRNALKQANTKVSLAAVDRSVKAYVSETSTAPTHHGYAKNVLQEFTEGAHKPVGHNGELFILDADSKLWESKPVSKLIRMVAEMHDGQDNCTRASDYRAVAEHAISLAADDAFFTDAPNGLACSSGFYQIINDDISLVPLAPEHRQRVMLNFTPVEMPTPMLDSFMNQTFHSENEGEEEQQCLLMQEIAGAIMLGILHKFQIAILFYDPFGRAGKGTLENILRKLVPPEFVSAISPFKWHQDYHVATLAGKRLNVVGELPENEPMPAAAFKSVIGGDLVTGRHPTHRPITFSNEAAHIFMSNHLITTKDQSEAFFARWKIVEFPNSRLRLGLPLDKDLAQRIIDSELPGIAYWALEGAARLLSNGKLSASTAHDRLMAKWRRCTNTLEEFIHEECELILDCTYRRSEFYRDYADWCSENGRKAFSKGRVKELLAHNIGHGIRLVEVNGYETFRGIMKKSCRPG